MLGGRRGAASVVAIAATAGCLTAGCANGGADAGGGPSAANVAGTALRWEPIATWPLPPRHDSVGAWTGTELVVVGGTTGPPCPPGADCAGEPRSTYRSDGAAYDPVSDSWRRIADAPVAVAKGLAAWAGDEVVVVAHDVAMTYDPDHDTWRRYDDPPVPVDDAHLVPTDDGLVLASYDSPARTHPQGPDYRLDLATGRWSALPDDPFGESYDRAMAWDGERLWLLSMAVAHHFAAYEGAPSRVAVLEGDHWKVVDHETPAVMQGQRWWWAGDRLVAPARAYRGDPSAPVLEPQTSSWSIDPAAGRWVGLPPPTPDRWGCDLPPIGPGEHWVAGGGPLVVAADPGTSVYLPPCEGIGGPDVAAWAGDDLIVWGGVDPDYRGDVAVGLRLSLPAPIG